MALVKQRSLFTIEDDGLIQRLDFSDCEDLEYQSNKFTSPVKCESSPMGRNRSSLSPSDDERLDSSTDSVLSDSFTGKRHTRRRLTRSSVKNSSSTPPYRKVRALRLFGSPQSPKTLLKQSELSTVNSTQVSEINSLTPKVSEYDHNHNKTRSLRRNNQSFTSVLETNINPFTQTPVLLGSQIKRRRDSGICR